MTPTQRAAMEQAIAALEGIQRYGLDTLSGRTDGPDDRQWQRAGVNEMTKRARLGIAPLRAALAEPAPVQEPIGWSITCNGGHTGNFFPYRETAEATLIELNRKYPTDKRTIEPLFAAQPRKAVKLSDSEIFGMWAGTANMVPHCKHHKHFARAIEQAVWAKNGWAE